MLLFDLIRRDGPSASRDGPRPSHHVGASEEDMAFLRAAMSARAKPLHRAFCRFGHALFGTRGVSLAYQRSDGRFECRMCRRVASQRYRDKAKLLSQ